MVAWSNLFRKSGSELSPAANELLEERPEAWEYRLFSTVLADEITLQHSLFRDYESGVSSGRRIELKNTAIFIRWMDKQMGNAEAFGPRIESLINISLPAALGPTGTPGDAGAIIDIARKTGKIYREAIQWALDIRRVSAEPRFTKLLKLSERLVEDMIHQIREFSAALSSSLEAALNDDSPGTKQIELMLKVTISPGVVEDIDKELKALKG